jgi:peptidoglycan hydrolase FlgJ
LAINPPSDLVLDVAAAAQPGKLQAATARLEKARAENAGEAFQAALANAAGSGAPPAAQAQSASAAAAPTTRNAPLIRKDTSQANAMEKFEAYFLQTAIQDMLPKNAEHVFGSGLAGDIWKSMLAEQIAAEMAKSTKFGIAERLAGKHFAMASAGGAPASSAAIARHDDANLAGSANNVPFLRDRRGPDLPTTGVLPTGGTAAKRS